jgi:hypothetical protein
MRGRGREQKVRKEGSGARVKGLASVKPMR